VALASIDHWRHYIHVNLKVKITVCTSYVLASTRGVEIEFFYSDVYTDTSKIRLAYRFAVIGRHAGVILGEIAAPSGDTWRV